MIAMYKLYKQQHNKIVRKASTEGVVFDIYHCRVEAHFAGYCYHSFTATQSELQNATTLLLYFQVYFALPPHASCWYNAGDLRIDAITQEVYCERAVVNS
jgi:hypothetical protein